MWSCICMKILLQEMGKLSSANNRHTLEDLLHNEPGWGLLTVP